ncbi:MAG TPA: polysaccharide biosynthesis/export family protein [Polyangia bacterium]|jgi:polysaccharide export outer membrane protein|nr:polysaccharide biosynthesis/export family protein [Polyangia bacterium]
MRKLLCLPWTLCFVACAHTTTPPPALPQADYRLGIDDLVDVAVWKDPALSATVPVRPDGKITLPMVGDLLVLDKTTREVEQEVQGKLKGFVAEPVVSVMVKEVKAGRFFVLGEVIHPGAYPLTNHLTVLQALALAGGPTEYARRGRMMLIRMSRDGKAERFQVNYDQVVHGKADAIRLLAGDTLYIP